MNRLDAIRGRAPQRVLILLEDAARHERDADRSRARFKYLDALGALPVDSYVDIASAIIRWIGRTYLDEGDLEAASDSFIAARAVAERQDDLSVIAHAVQCQALVHHIRGELDEAVELYEWAQKRARLVGDTKLDAMIHQNLGVVANVRGDLPSALEHYRKSLDGYRSLGLTNLVGPLWTNIGRLQTDLRMWDQAQVSLGKAQEECVEAGQQSYQVLVEVNRARLWASRGDFVQAREACDGAYEMSSQISDDRWTGEIHKQYGIIHRETGKLQLARDHLIQAHQIGLDREDCVLAADAASELGTVCRRQGDNGETLKYFLEAHRLFRDLEARREIADIDARKDRFETSFLAIVESWGASIESQDSYTQGHSRRVADQACRLAEADGLDPELMIWFRMGALLHDVGKITIPLEILNKVDPLTTAEFDVIRSHAEAGAEIVSGLDFPWDIEGMVRHHHERWDGKGYPHGLAGDEIPRAAQILAIADAYDAMTTDRSYRKALWADEALEIIRKDAGTAFNPDLAELFIKLASTSLSILESDLTSAASA